ncbi:MAG: T9SS type A sorting domain-containing protein, partial [Ignavibacteria bacterium]|nr:T9SS type A sorting domain-containing protein [Ignavibacteria bacterium]
PLTMILYQMPVDSRITIRIYDILGQVIATLYEGYQTAGHHSVTWDAGNHPTGVYYCRMTAPGFVQTSTLTLVR